MPLPRPTRPISTEHSDIAAPLSQTVHRATPTQYKPSDVFLYQPAPDITTFELAELLALFFNGIMVHHDIFEKLPENLKKHFLHRRTV